MKLTFSTLGCPNWTLDQIIAGAKSAGCQGVDFRGLGPEIDITKLPAFNEDLDRTLHAFRENKLELPCLNTSVKLVAPAGNWPDILDEFQRYARLAQGTGTPYLRVFGGAAAEGMARDEAELIATRHLRQLVKISAAHQCIPLVETHDAWRTSDQLLLLMSELNSSQAGILWDIEHTVRAGEPPERTARQLQGFIRHTHFKDLSLVGETYQPRLLGEGDMPVKAAFAALKSIGYAGWYCLESEKRWHPDVWPEPEILIPQFAQYMQSLDQQKE